MTTPPTSPGTSTTRLTPLTTAQSASPGSSGPTRSTTLPSSSNNNDGDGNGKRSVDGNGNGNVGPFGTGTKRRSWRGIGEGNGNGIGTTTRADTDPFWSSSTGPSQHANDNNPLSAPVGRAGSRSPMISPSIWTTSTAAGLPSNITNVSIPSDSLYSTPGLSSSTSLPNPSDLTSSLPPKTPQPNDHLTTTPSSAATTLPVSISALPTASASASGAALTSSKSMNFSQRRITGYQQGAISVSMPINDGQQPLTAPPMMSVGNSEGGQFANFPNGGGLGVGTPGLTTASSFTSLSLASAGGVGGGDDQGYFHSGEEDINECDEGSSSSTGGKKRKRNRFYNTQFGRRVELINNKVMGFPNLLLGFLFPSATTLHHHPHHYPLPSPNKFSNGGPPKSRYSQSSPPPRRPLLIRILILFYVAFSLLHITFSFLIPQASSFFHSSSISNLLGLGDETKSMWNTAVKRGSDFPGFGAVPGLDPNQGIQDAGLDAVVGLTEEGKGVDGIGPGTRVTADMTEMEAGTGKVNVKRQWGDEADPIQNPMSYFQHRYSLSKLHGKVLGTDLRETGDDTGEVVGANGERVIPFFLPSSYFHSASASSSSLAGDVTALLFFTPRYLDLLPLFISRWDAPVSLIFHSPYALESSEFKKVRQQMEEMRNHPDGLIRKWVDWHVILDVSPSGVTAGLDSDTNPATAQNWHLNLARFYSRTAMVWFVGDARIIPGGEMGLLKRKLNTEMVRRAALNNGDMVVVPRFAWISSGSEGEDVDPRERDLLSTTPLPPDQWPSTKSKLVQFVNNRTVGMWDSNWPEWNQGPSNFGLWKKGRSDPKLGDDYTKGGGLGLGFPPAGAPLAVGVGKDGEVVTGTMDGPAGTFPTTGPGGSLSALGVVPARGDSSSQGIIGGGKNLYLITNYDLHYSPSYVMSREGHPWCTERFERKWEACVYQNYLGGAEVWGLPEGWVWTLERRDDSEKEKVDKAEQIKRSISSKLYTKFHQEACMHYGRELLAFGLWNQERARHIRSICARVFSSWGVGLVSNVASE